MRASRTSLARSTDGRGLRSAGILGRMHETPSGTSLGTKAIAAVVLLVAAWVLLKVVIGTVIAVAWTAVAILAVCAVIWAFFTLRR